ncbi:MAG: class I SAM-dependent methyltransferase [Planctomycetota bacterium]
MRIALGTPFDRIGQPGSFEEVSLRPLANRLELRELREFLHRASYLVQPGGRVCFVTRDPDDYPDDIWPGEQVELQGSTERARSLRQILELLRLFPLRVRTPRHVDATGKDRLPEMHDLQWIATRTSAPEQPARTGSSAPIQERYAPTSAYRRFDRLEEPEIADDLYYAASRLRPLPSERVLALGVNDGRELEIFESKVRDQIDLWGIDHSVSAIEAARLRHPRHAARMLLADVADLQKLDLPPMHCALLLNVLQCTNIDRERLLRDLFSLLTPDARLLASIPNCHFGPNDILRRPLQRKDPRHDRSLVFKDARFLARSLYRAGFKTVETFGTLDVMILARR